MKKTKSAEFRVMEAVPSYGSETAILEFLDKNDKEINWDYINAIRKATGYSDEAISRWLNISVRTLHTYRRPTKSFKENTKEQLVLLLGLFKHGISVFGSAMEFDKWLDNKNFFFDYKAPVSFLNTVTGISFVNDRLTAMEYGDNV